MMQNSNLHFAPRTEHIAEVSAGCVALFVVLVLTHLPTVVFAQAACPGIHAKILNIRNSAVIVAMTDTGEEIRLLISPVEQQRRMRQYLLCIATIGTAFAVK